MLARNIAGLTASRQQQERRKSRQERISDAITRFTGSMRFVYIHAVLFGAWIVWNLGWIPGVPLFDPSFVVLAMAASVEAIFLSTFVLISQNRMQAQAEKRAELDLQISLLAEHEVTQLMALLDAVARQFATELSKNRGRAFATELSKNRGRAFATELRVADELLHAVVASVGDVQHPLGIDGDRLGVLQLA
ncbi:MAG: DUF1003 domain-containing protein [Chloroflexi bacterium]|nr:DUF1003 domain-containing protein [Chloroflexota bacterium]